MNFHLNIVISESSNKDYLLNYYKQTKFITSKQNIYCQDDESSGLDLIIPNDIIIKKKSTQKINLEISCEPIFKLLDKEIKVGYDLRARSSISKTPLRLSNGIGTIDYGYRGNIIAAVDNISDEDYKIEKGQRLFQLVNPMLSSIEYSIVDTISTTKRGEGGFGSTGK